MRGVGVNILWIIGQIDGKGKGVNGGREGGREVPWNIDTVGKFYNPTQPKSNQVNQPLRI